MLGLIASTLLLAASQNAAPAPTTTLSPATVQPPAVTEKDRVECRREHVVGSNRPKKICRTVGQWEELSDRTRQQLDGRREQLDELRMDVMGVGAGG